MNIDIQVLKDAVKFISDQVTMTKPTDGSEPEPATEADWEKHQLACALACEIDKIQYVGGGAAVYVEPGELTAEDCRQIVKAANGNLLVVGPL